MRGEFDTLDNIDWAKGAALAIVGLFLSGLLRVVAGDRLAVAAESRPVLMLGVAPTIVAFIGMLVYDARQAPELRSSWVKNLCLAIWGGVVTFVAAQAR